MPDSAFMMEAAVMWAVFMFILRGVICANKRRD